MDPVRKTRPGSEVLFRKSACLALVLDPLGVVGVFEMVLNRYCGSSWCVASNVGPVGTEMSDVWVPVSSIEYLGVQ